MENYPALKVNPRGQQSLATSETVETHARRSLALHDRFKLENPSCSDLYYQQTKNRRDISPRRSWNVVKQWSKVTQNEELVKYMSNLPNYLQRGEYCQENVLNVGVLDWGRLEKWQCSRKQNSQGSSRHAFSSGNSSSSQLTEESSVNYSSIQSCSPAYQKMPRRSLQFHFMSSTVDVQSQDTKSFDDNFKKFQYVNSGPTDTKNEPDKFLRARKSFAEIRLVGCDRKDSHSKVKPETESFSGTNSETPQGKVKTIVRNGEYMKGVNKLQRHRTYAADTSKNDKRVVVHPTDHFQDNQSFFSESTTLCRQASEAPQRGSLKMPESSPEVPLSSDVPHSCPLICENHGCTEMKQCPSDAESISLSPDSFCSVPDAAKRGISPSRGRIPEIKTSGSTWRISTSGEPPAWSELKPKKAAAQKPSTSPFGRLGIGMSKIGKSFSSKQDSSLPHSSTSRSFAKPAFASATVSPSRQSTSSDIQNATSRARSSPLRRLLDPLLKPRVPSCHQYVQPLQRDSLLMDRTPVSFRGQVDSSSGSTQPGILNSDTVSNVNDPCRNKKLKSTRFQAFLQVALKNGFPLFTFAVGNELNVLAATVKKLSSLGEDEYSCIYTFFAIKEVKKKNGRWISKGGDEDKGRDYISNVVAQLKVSSSQFPQYFAREFVLFSVDLGQAEQQIFDLQPTDELAAIDIKIPKIVHKSINKDGHQASKSDDFPEMRYDSTSGKRTAIKSQNLLCTTVILPSGVHSLPNKGGPSSLIQRWRSGGSCDCGGWDLGCKLRIFANNVEFVEKSASFKACSVSDKFELVSQGGDDNVPVFSLASRKDGVYSVEFTASLSVLQAFSICIAVLDSKSRQHAGLVSLEIMEGLISKPY